MWVSGTNLHLRVKNGENLASNHQNLLHRGGSGDTVQDIRLNEMVMGRRRGRWEGGRGSKDRNVVVDLGAVPLCDALCDPDDVPALLLLQLDVGIENTEVELVEEGQLVQLHLQVGRRKRLMSVQTPQS